MIQWNIYTASTRFEDFADTWNQINAGSGALPFMDADFLAPLLIEFGADRPVMLAIGSDEKGPAACALLWKTKMGVWETWQPSQLPLGAWLCRPDLDLINAAATLLGKLPGLKLSLGITQLDPLYCPRPAPGNALETMDYIETAWVDVEGTYDDYWESRGKNLRQNMRKQRNKLSAEGITPSLEVLNQPDQMSEAMREYGVLESAGWKADLGTSISLDNAQGRFYLEMMKRFCNSGRGFVYRYLFDDKVVAMDICIADSDTLVILKTTYDESISKTYSPAFLMHQDVFRQIWESGRFKRIEFYGKRLEWHTRWTENTRTLYHLTIFSSGLIKTIRQSASHVLSRMRKRSDQKKNHEAAG